MRKKIFTCFVFITLVLGPIVLMAQQDSLILKFNKDSYEVGDTISFAALYTSKGQPIDKGSLFLKLIDQTGRFLEMRWPILGGISQGDLVIPDSFPASKLKFFFGASKQFFAVYGFLKKPGKIKNLGVTLITQDNKWLVEDIPITKDGYFEYKDRIFENEATIFFSNTVGKSDYLDIEITSLVDSAIPVLSHYEQLVNVGDFGGNDSVLSKLTSNNLDSFLNSRAKLLAPVVVTGKKLTMAERFSDKYSTGMFRGFYPKLFDLLEDPLAQTANDMADYLGRFVYPKTSFLRGPLQFYLDEMRVDWETASMIPLSEVAIVKAFPSPFFLNPAGAGSAVAIYTKRGEFYTNLHKHTFRVRGYTPQTSSLKLSF